MASIHYRIAGYLVTIILHIGNAAYMISSFHGDVMKNEYVRHFRDMQIYFYTCWTFFFQTMYALLGLYCDLMTLKKYKNQDYTVLKVLTNVQDLFFSIVVWPSTMTVFFVFWAFYIYDRNLLYPKDIDIAITSTSNHIMHSFIILVTTWEVVFKPRVPPKSHIWRQILLWLLEITYIMTLLGVYRFKGVWVYPVFGRLYGSVYFYLFFVLVAAFLVVVYQSQWILNNFIWKSKNRSLEVDPVTHKMGYVLDSNDNIKKND